MNQNAFNNQRSANKAWPSRVASKLEEHQQYLALIQKRYDEIVKQLEDTFEIIKSLKPHGDEVSRLAEQMQPLSVEAFQLHCILENKNFEETWRKQFLL